MHIMDTKGLTIVICALDHGLTPEDPRWISAWWLGFIVFGGGACLVAVPVFRSPRSLSRKSNVYANAAAVKNPPDSVSIKGVD